MWGTLCLILIIATIVGLIIWKSSGVEEREGDRDEWETYIKEIQRRRKVREEHPEYVCIKFKTLIKPKGNCPKDLKKKYGEYY